MDLAKLDNLLNQQPPWRRQQVRQVIFKDLKDDWQQATTLPNELRRQLNETCPLKITAATQTSRNRQSEKALLTLSDNAKIETVLMKSPDGRRTVCLSSQIGCPLGCTFCTTGRLKFERNLETSEILEQYLYFARRLKTAGEKITNVVFMGMGEPLLNLDNVLEAINILNDPAAANLGARHISVSTAGLPDGIREIARFPLQINLALSLNAPNDELRSRLMPINKKYPLQDVLAAIDYYIKITRRQVMFEYVLLKDTNDSPAHARELARLVSGRLAIINLIPANPGTIGKEPPAPEIIDRFHKILEESGCKVSRRRRFGDDIQGACGELAAGK
jgi:23S rRNA (adenine2503-C2)-methyltransferase